MKTNKYLQKVVLLFGLLLFSNKVLSQLFLEVKPGFKFGQTSFFKTKTTIKKANGVDFYVSPKKQISRFCFEPELFLDFYRFGDKWSIGVGLTSYNWQSRNDFLASRRIKSDSTIHSGLEQSLIAKNIQFVFTISRKIEFKKPILKGNTFTIGLGINKILNPIDDFVDFGTTNLGFKLETGRLLLGSTLSNNYSPLLMLKYELIFSKLNIHVSYIQGYSNFNGILTTAKSADVNLRSVTTSLGSGLRIGISKTFKFEQSK